MPFDKKTGRFVTDDGSEFDFLPDEPAESAPYEFIHAGSGLPDRLQVRRQMVVARSKEEVAAALEAGQSPNRHYLIDPEEVAEFYESAGKEFKRAGSKEKFIVASKAHIANVEKAQKAAAGAEEPAKTKKGK